jgi:hypothetical protein
MPDRAKMPTVDLLKLLRVLAMEVPESKIHMAVLPDLFVSLLAMD